MDAIDEPTCRDGSESSIAGAAHPPIIPTCTPWWWRGALPTDGRSWHPSRIDFHLPVKALSKIYRARFRAEMEKAGRLHEISPRVWKLPWNVNCQAVGESFHTLKYLAPYVFKVAIANSRIISVENRVVTFRTRYLSIIWKG